MQSAVIDSAVPVAANAEHTLQICFRWEWDFGTERGIHATANNTPGSGIGNDYINRVNGRTDGALQIFTENNDTNVFASSSVNAIRAGFWQFATFVFTIQDANNFDCRIFVHTLENNGTVTGIGGDSLGFDKQVTTLRCDTSSGLTDGRITYGQSNLGTRNYIGNIALGRFVKEALTDEQADAQAREFLTTGTLAAWGSNELYRHEFNEEPHLVDEGPLGCHIWSQGDVYGDDNALDLVGSGGKAFRPGSDPRYALLNYTIGASLQAITGHGAPVYTADFFTDDIVAVPEWTIQYIGVPVNPNTGTLSIALLNQASGESLPTNHVVSLSIDQADGIFNYFAERGSSGTNITLGTTTGAGSFSSASQLAPKLYTIRCGEDPGSPGTMLLRLSEDDNLDIHTAQTSGVPQGGESNIGLSLPFDNGGLIQEVAFFTRQLTDEEIQATAANYSPGGDGSAPVISNVTPAAGTQLATQSTPIQFDVTDITPGLQLVAVSVKFANRRDTQLVYDGTKFLYPFDAAGSQTTAITNGLRFVVAPRGRWIGDIEELFVYAIDSAGNLEGLPS